MASLVYAESSDPVPVRHWPFENELAYVRGFKRRRLVVGTNSSKMLRTTIKTYCELQITCNSCVRIAVVLLFPAARETSQIA